VTIVYEDAVGFEDLLELVEETLPGCLNPQYFRDLVDVVGVGFGTVDFWVQQTVFEVANAFEHDVLLLFGMLREADCSF
jgi:hypothetical protein